ncbi:MAG: hypothetical protein RXR51_02665 [Nitrososphaeria archaeon]
MAKPNEEVWASMLSEDQVKWIVNAKLEGKLITGKLQACKEYQPEGYSSFTANTKVQGYSCSEKSWKT